jgi:hypothetical protein
MFEDRIMFCYDAKFFSNRPDPDPELNIFLKKLLLRKKFC